MADITVVNDTGELKNLIKKNKSEVFLQSQKKIIIKIKLHIN